MCLFIQLFVAQAHAAVHDVQLPSAPSTHAIDSVLSVLDTEISHRAVLRAKKETGLEQLKNSLRRSQSEDVRFELCHEIFQEYYNYQSDSAYHYAQKAFGLGQASGDSVKITRAQVALLRIFSSSGLLKEGADVLAEINPAYLQGENMVLFYTGADFLFDNLRAHAEGYEELEQKYRNQRNLYSGLFQKQLGPSSRETFELDRELASNQSVEKEIALRCDLVTHSRLSLHELAIQHACIGSAYQRLGDAQSAKYHYALSSIYDQRMCNNETMASFLLAETLYNEGDIERASRYIHVALEEAEFFNSRVRKMQINAILPKIELAMLQDSELQTRKAFIVASVFFLMTILVIVLLTKVRHRNRRLSAAHRDSKEKARLLDEVNIRLTILNGKLQEADEIKNHCIMETLYGNQAFVMRVDKACKSIERKVKARLLDDIPHLLHEMGVREESQRTLTTFDHIFLHMFPTFIEDLNGLLVPGFQLSLNADGAMPTEARVFALMRLGITDATTQAQYLNISPNSLYVYKAKVKSHAKGEKENFERSIMEIRHRDAL